MEDGGGEQPLSAAHGGGDFNGEENHPLLERKGGSGDAKHDLQPINGVADFAGEFLSESRKIWCLAGPAIFASFCQYGLITTTQIFAGHLGTTQLAALSVANNIISGIPYGMMLGM